MKQKSTVIGIVIGTIALESNLFVATKIINVHNSQPNTSTLDMYPRETLA